MVEISTGSLPEPPGGLAFGEVGLRFERMVPADPRRGFVPGYHFRMVTRAGEVGHINFRIGDTDHIRLYAGHIGYEVQEAFRGHRYAYQACLALAPLVRAIYTSVIITADPDNYPSLRTIQRLGAVFINEVPVPKTDPNYERGSRTKRRFQWTPPEVAYQRPLAEGVEQ